MPETLHPVPEPRRLLLMACGNWLSRALAVAVRRNLFGRAIEGLNLEQVGAVLGSTLRPSRMMTDVLVAAGLLERREARFHPSAEAAAYLVPGRPDYLGDLVLMFDSRLYRAWGRLEEALAKDGPVVETYLDALPDPEEAERLVAEAIQGLHGITALATRAFLDRLDLSGVRKALDLGGGSGALAITLAQRLPQVAVRVVDQAPVLKVVARNAESAGVRARLELLERNFFQDPLPGGMDLVTLSNILHDWSRDQGAVLVARSFEALRPGGRLVVNEWLIDEDRSGPLLSALISLCMLIETTAGENLTGQEIGHLMEETGFTDVVCMPTLHPHGIVTGVKPEI